MTNILRKFIFAAAGVTLTLTTIRANDAQADPISTSEFGSSAIVESFEGLSPGTIIPQIVDTGVLKPGVNGPFTFNSGVTLTGPIPNEPPPSAAGIEVGDFSIGDASFGLGENGQITSADDVPDGSAYLALNADPGPIEFTFNSDMLRVGALVTGGRGFIILSAFDASGHLLETVSVSKVNVSNWRSNFVGLENSAGIRKITFSDSDVGSGFNTLVLDRLTFEPIASVVEVAIDIKPGSFPNSINPKSKGKIPVAILTTDSFDATIVDPTTVLFGATGTEAAPVHSALEDVDGDGDTDMILHFKTQETGIQCGDTSASLTGETLGGQAIEGSDSIRTVGCK